VKIQQLQQHVTKEFSWIEQQ